jgi:glycosyltransferase 2 family protein
MKIRRRWSLLLRALCAIALVALLVFGIDWHSLPYQLSHVSWPPALLAMAGLGAHFIVSPWKWQQALRMHRLEFSLSYLLRANGTGFFLNNFFPSAIGGDAYRVFRTLPSDGQRPRALSAVIVERLVGFAALLFLGGIGALLWFSESAVARTYLALISAGAVLSAILGAALYRGWFKRLTDRVRHRAAFEAVRYNIEYLLRGGRFWISLIAISLLFQLIAIANVYLLFQALGTPVSLPACALIGAVSMLAAILPISINGIGVFEGSFAGTAVALGVPYEPALAVALLIRLLVLPPSLVFGALYVLKGDAPVPRPDTVSA